MQAGIVDSPLQTGPRDRDVSLLKSLYGEAMILQSERFGVAFQETPGFQVSRDLVQHPNVRAKLLQGENSSAADRESKISMGAVKRLA